MTRVFFAPHPAVAHQEAMARNLASKTGRDLEAWARLAASAPPERGARVAWLKGQGLGTGQAMLVAEYSLGLADPFLMSEAAYLAAAPGLVDAQFPPKKAHLRPLFDRLLQEALALGPDVKACPCATMVPLYRVHVFAQLKVSTSTRLDLGLALGDPARVEDPTGRLRDAGGFARKDRITHRLEVRDGDGVDPFLLDWLRRAYEADAP